MSIIKHYYYNLAAITAHAIDNYNGYYIWIAFTSVETDICHMQKLYAFNPYQLYYDVEVECDKIIKIASKDNTNELYLAIEDTSNLGYRYSKSTPSTALYTFVKPVGILEHPVDIIATTDRVYFLIPGNTSGTNTKILEFNLTGTLLNTINLATVTNAKSFTIDSNDEIWVITDESPSRYIRVYYDGGWLYTIFI